MERDTNEELKSIINDNEKDHEKEELKKKITHMESQIEHMKQEKTEGNKLLNFLKGQQLSQVITTTILKVFFSVLFFYFFMGKSDLSISSIITGFLLFYAICTVFAFSLKVTQNYIIAIIVMLALLFGVAYFVDKIAASLGSIPIITDILIYVTFLLPVVYDAYKIVQLSRKNDR